MFAPRQLAFSALMATIMSALIGGALTLIRAGADGFWSAFWGTAPIAFAVALPVGVFVTPLVQKLVLIMFGPEKEQAS